MTMLSNKRRNHAMAVGQAIAQGILIDYASHGTSYFPKGLKSLAEMVEKLARVNLFTSCAWKPTKEEEEIAAKAARQDVETAFRVAKKYREFGV